MNDAPAFDRYAALTEPDTLMIQRLLPGPAPRVWAALTDSSLRRCWLAEGEMKMQVGAPFELVWRNDELSNPPGTRPEGFPEEFRMASRITEIDPPRKLSFTWQESGDVSFLLAPQGPKALLTVVHRGLIGRERLLNIAAGWHMHLDILEFCAKGEEPGSFWDGWLRLKQEYGERF